LSKFKEYWARQFGKPTGAGGKLAALIMNRINTAMYKTVESLAPQNGAFLEIGFGNGVLLKRLLSKRGGAFYGVEISADMLKAAARRNGQAVKDGRLTLAGGAADAIPYDAEFDFVYTVNTVYFWRDPNAALLEIYSKLKPGGVFLNAVYTKEWLDKLSYTRYGYAKYSQKELEQAAEAVGFTTEIIPIAAGKSYAVKALKNDR
jgi:SAM-dependent methyltransferase